MNFRDYCLERRNHGQGSTLPRAALRYLLTVASLGYIIRFTEFALNHILTRKLPSSGNQKSVRPFSCVLYYCLYSISDTTHTSTNVFGILPPTVEKRLQIYFPASVSTPLSEFHCGWSSRATIGVHTQFKLY